MQNVLALHMLQDAAFGEACSNSNISCDSGASCHSDISCDSNQSRPAALYE